MTGAACQKKLSMASICTTAYQDSAETREYFAYYNQNTLCAVRDQQWKLHVNRSSCWGNEPGTTVCELYDYGLM